MKPSRLILALLAFPFISCQEGGSSGNGDRKAKNFDDKPQSCQQVLVGDNTSGGCRIRLVTPSNCEVIDLSNGNTYEFAWTTDGSTCELPFTLYLAANPANPETGENVYSWTFYEDINNGITRQNGVIRVNAEIFSQFPSSDGVYHWLVKGHYGSHPASQSFRVKK